MWKKSFSFYLWFNTLKRAGSEKVPKIPECPDIARKKIFKEVGFLRLNSFVFRRHLILSFMDFPNPRVFWIPEHVQIFNFTAFARSKFWDFSDWNSNSFGQAIGSGSYWDLYLTHNERAKNQLFFHLNKQSLKNCWIACDRNRK